MAVPPPDKDLESVCGCHKYSESAVQWSRVLEFPSSSNPFISMFFAVLSKLKFLVPPKFIFTVPPGSGLNTIGVVALVLMLILPVKL